MITPQWHRLGVRWCRDPSNASPSRFSWQRRLLCRPPAGCWAHLILPRPPISAGMVQRTNQRHWTWRRWNCTQCWVGCGYHRARKRLGRHEEGVSLRNV